MYKLFALALIVAVFSISSAFAQEYRNFNGLMIRVDNAAKQGMKSRDFSRIIEIQIADDRGFSPRDYHNGCVFDSLSGPKPITFYNRNELPHRGWNSMKVIADGAKITTYVNGAKVIDGTLPQNKLSSSSGRIGLMGFGGTTTFRNISIKELP